jgi:hypothetical protein
MEASCPSQQHLQYLSEFQKQLDAAQLRYQQQKNSNDGDTDVNNINLASFKLEWLFEKIEEDDPLFLDLHLLRLYIISKLFKLSNSSNIIDASSLSHINHFVKHIVDTKISLIVAWLDSSDDLIGHTAMNTLIDICLTPATSHVTANLYMNFVRHATFTSNTTTRQTFSARILNLFIKQVKLALKSIKTETDDGEINTNNAHFVEAMKLVYLFGNSSEVRVELLKHRDEDSVRDNIELYILLLKLLTYLNEEHLPSQFAVNFKVNLVRDCLFVLGASVTAEHSHLTVKKYLRLCSLLTSVLSLADLQQMMNVLHSFTGVIFTALRDNETSIFGQQIVLATRRLFILLVLDITKNLLSNMTSSEHVTLLSKVGNSTVSLLKNFVPKELIATFFELFQEQDDDLMTGLWHLLSVHMQWNLSATRGVIGANLPRALVEAISGLLSTLNPHVMFHELLTVVDFDHNVLLDFLVSNETDFLLYLLQYLKYVSTDWQGFKTVLAQFDSNEAEQYLEDAKNSDMSEESKRELEEMLSMSKLKINHEHTNMQVEVKHVIDVLHKLGVAINRLVAKDLFPYNISPLLKWISTAEQLFEQK